MSNAEEFFDPYEAHLHRDPLPGAAVRVVVIAEGDTDRSQAVAHALVDLLAGRGRVAESVVVDVKGLGSGPALEKGLEGSTCPVAIVTTAVEPLSDSHVEPLLVALDHCDHVVGRRPASFPVRVVQRAVWVAYRILFAVPVRDVHSPIRAHRLDKLAAIPLQSSSSFLDVEMLAKATFFGHLIDEVEVPPLAGHHLGRYYWLDLVDVFRRPVLVRPPASTPSENSQRDDEGDDRPGGEDGQGDHDVMVEQPRPFEDDSAEGLGQLGQREGLDQRLDGGGEAI